MRSVLELRPCLALLLVGCVLAFSIPTTSQAQESAPVDEFAEEFDAPDQSAEPDEATPGPAGGADALADPAGAPVTPEGYGGEPANGGGGVPNTAAGSYAPAPASPIYVTGPTRPPSRAPGTHANMITIDPFAAIQGLVVLSYHRAISQRVSFYVGPEYLIPDTLAENLSGGGLILGLGIHLIRPAPTGLWFGPRFEALVLDDGFDRGVGILAGAMTGYTWQWGHFTLSLGAGASYVHLEVNGRTVRDDVIATGRSALGFAF